MKGLAWRPNFDALLDSCEKIKRGHRILIFVGTFVLLIGGFVWLCYLPLTEDIQRTEKEIRDLEHKINLAKIQIKKLPELKEKEAELTQAFKNALRLLPNKREIPTLLAGVSQLGVNSQLQFKLFSPGKEETKEFYVEIPVSIEVSGRYRDLALFFHRVGKMARIVNIVNISIKPEQELSTTLNTKCKAITYRFKTAADEAKEKAAKKKK